MQSSYLKLEAEWIKIEERSEKREGENRGGDSGLLVIVTILDAVLISF